MNTITLTLEATPENLRKLLWAMEGPIELTTPETAEPKKPAKDIEEPPKGVEDPTVPEPAAPKIDKTALRELGLKLTKAGKQEELKNALKDFGATKLSQVKEEHYEALGRRLQEALS
jgi:hypothetical protein